jgi:predicted N-acyltransferase
MTVKLSLKPGQINSVSIEEYPFLNVDVPFLPPIGSTIILSKEQNESLIKQITSNIKVAKSYSDHFYYTSNIKGYNEISEIDYENCEIDSFLLVSDIYFNFDDNNIQVLLTR